MSAPNKFEDLIARGLFAVAVVGTPNKPELSVIEPGTASSITARADFMGVMALLHEFKSQTLFAAEFDRPTEKALGASFVALVEQIVTRIESTALNCHPKRESQT